MRLVGRSMWKQFLLLTGMLIGLAVVAVPATAQATKTVTYDTPVEGQITDAAPEEVWSLVAPAADRITVVVERTGGTLAPTFEIRDANNQALQSGYTDDSGARSEVDKYQFPAAGNYTIAVNRKDAADGKTSGNYKLTVKLLGAGEDNPSLNVAPKPIDFGTPASGELTNARWRETWTFTTPAADVISIDAVRADGTVRPELELLDSNGSNLTTGYLSDDGTSASITNYALPGPGQYSIRVRREGQQSGATTGKYAITLKLEGAGTERPELLAPKGPAKVDSILSGELTGAQWVNVWTLDSPSAYHLQLTATRTDGSLIPTVYVLGANNQELRRGYPSDDKASATLDIELPGPGSYQLRVARENEKTGHTEGKYELAVVLLGAGADDPAFKTVAGAITLDTPVKGSLTNAKWKDSWTFSAQSAGEVTITVTRSSGTLSPQLALLGANQQDLTSAYPDATLATATIERFNLPGPGQYTIVVYRERERDGTTTGGYELSIAQAK